MRFAWKLSGYIVFLSLAAACRSPMDPLGMVPDTAEAGDIRVYGRLDPQQPGYVTLSLHNAGAVGAVMSLGGCSIIVVVYRRSTGRVAFDSHSRPCDDYLAQYEIVAGETVEVRRPVGEAQELAQFTADQWIAEAIVRSLEYDQFRVRISLPFA